MSVKFFDLQNANNPDNGVVVNDAASLKSLLIKNASHPPFTVELIFEGKLQLMIGLGPKLCCAQHSATNGDSRYLVAFLESERMKTGEVKFMLSRAPTEILRKHCFPLEVLLNIAAYFAETGERSPDVQWEDA